MKFESRFVQHSDVQFVETGYLNAGLKEMVYQKTESAEVEVESPTGQFFSGQFSTF